MSGPVVKVDRREFLKIGGTAGVGLVLGFRLGCAPAGRPPAAAFEPDAFVVLDRDGTTTVWVPRAELGQGVLTTLPMILADEMGADWNLVRAPHAPADPKYGNMTTGGSKSVRDHWESFRVAGATAREMLVAAAADLWGVPPGECRAVKGEVIHEATDRQIPFGDLVEEAARYPVPGNPPLKESSEWTLIGKSIPRVDLPSKVDGSAVFGSDFTLPDMAYAVLARPPKIGGDVLSFDGTKALASPGVRNVFKIRRCVAVVADTTWAALKGRDLLEVEWDEGPNADLDDDKIAAILEAEADEENPPVARSEGDVAGAYEGAAKIVEAEYRLPYLAHSTMEPMNGSAWFEDDRCRVWIPTQNPRTARSTVAGSVKIPLENVTIQPLLAGGGFGRRLRSDFAHEAATASKIHGGPVKLFWTREEDTRNDFYRPASLHRMKAALDGEGRITAWWHRVATPSIAAQFKTIVGPDHSTLQGSADLTYRFPNQLVECARPTLPVPIGPWRAVYNNNNAFANESFLDEIALAAGIDPVRLRLDLLPEGSRLRGVVARAADAARWDRGAPAGSALGFACHECYGTAVAEVAEISVSKGRVRVHRVVCAVDPGVAVHPDGIAAQMEGGIAYGLSAALRGGITIRNGSVLTGNFDEETPLRMNEMPEVEVHIVESGEPVGGVGEPPVPPIAAAVTNALYAATGIRVRRLPIERALRES